MRNTIAAGTAATSMQAQTFTDSLNFVVPYPQCRWGERCSHPKHIRRDLGPSIAVVIAREIIYIGAAPCLAEHP